jgi:hypothetical protein
VQVHVTPEAERLLRERRDAGGERPGPTAQRSVGLVAVDRGLARGVQRHEVHPQAGVEDLARGVRIDIGIEFGIRGDVAGHVHRARHHDHAASPPQGIGIEAESERQVCQRAQRDERQSLAVGPG